MAGGDVGHFRQMARLIWRRASAVGQATASMRELQGQGAVPRARTLPRPPLRRKTERMSRSADRHPRQATSPDTRPLRDVAGDTLRAASNSGRRVRVGEHLPAWQSLPDRDFEGLVIPLPCPARWPPSARAKAPAIEGVDCLARLWRDQGKRAEARDLLGPIYPGSPRVSMRRT